MGVLTTATRMYLTRSFKPFTFIADDGRKNPAIEETERPGLYVHIPFCRSICNFCPYCKVQFDQTVFDRYIDALKQEIIMVSGGLPVPKETTSLYFGGGTPALAADRLGEIIELLKKYYIITDGIGVELHPHDGNTETLQKLKNAGVSRISIGIQSFQEKFQTLLGRETVDAGKIKNALSQVGFETVSMDFIFALPGQQTADLKADIDTAFASGANHVAIYPFINFSFTPTPVQAMKKQEKRRLLDEITGYFETLGCHRDSIWTFARSKDNRYSSMTRDNFIGFGCSATTLLKDQFRINTFPVEAYCRRIEAGRLPITLRCDFSRRQRMIYWLFWRAYTTRMKISDFERCFGMPLKKVFGVELKLAEIAGMIIIRGDCLELTAKGAFYFHYYEGFYTLSYIDRMWGLLRHQPFPAGMTL